MESDTRIKHYGTVIEYKCPEGFIFDLPEGFNDTDILELKCESWSDWYPSIQPKCKAKECEEPFQPPGGDKGNYDFKGNKTFSVLLNYTCDTPGWGYPSNGLSNVSSLCQADQTWTVKDVEECICKYKLQCTNMQTIFDFCEFQYCHVQKHLLYQWLEDGAGMEFNQLNINVPMATNLSTMPILTGIPIVLYKRYGIHL